MEKLFWGHDCRYYPAIDESVSNRQARMFLFGMFGSDSFKSNLETDILAFHKVLFQVTYDRNWHGFEMFLFVLLGVAGVGV